MKFEATIGEQTHSLELHPKDHSYTFENKQGSYEFSYENGRYMLRSGTKLYKLDNVSYEGSVVHFTMNGVHHSVDVKNEQDLLLDRLGFKTGAAVEEGILNAPMPGKILDILVAEGDEIEKDQPLVILEAMKMENELKAPVGGSIAVISANIGQSLEKNSPILEIKTIG
ncbi:MAG: acetyl-CoA carboxylase biotin carboxyl carrier protein subunit [Balneolaceae bacterium]|nr:acetyl-CoA carboxylase biotin carboxyl carrier protein subunit [Balneolaceae bacterium]